MSGEMKLTAAQRAAAVDRIGENIALRSGAGCGKTLVLARRFTELLLKSGGKTNPLARFVALTFTDKAALEMKQRVRTFLTERAAASKDEDRRRLLGWLSELPEARISTIHSFCASLLRTHAIEAGVDPNFAVCADELFAARMRAESAEQAVLRAVEADQSGAAKLLGEISYDKLVRLVVTLLGWRLEADLSSYADPGQILSRWRAHADKARSQAWSRLQGDHQLGESVTELAAIECSAAEDKLLPIRNQIVDLAEALLSGPDGRTTEAFEQLASVAPGSCGSNKAWAGGSAKAVRDRIRSLQAAMGQYAIYAEPLGDLDAEAADRLSGLAGLAVSANEIYTAEKTKRGLLDFTDLLDHAGRLLTQNEPLRRRIADGIDQLLIDESQDINSHQLRILLSLLCGGQDVSKAGAGKLFIVGDAKQSIYRFRGARVEVFQQICRDLGDKQQENLDTSFRTHPGGAAFINHLFAPLMGDDYEPIRASRTQCPPAPAAEILLAATPDSPIANAPQANQAQARAVAQRISEMLDGAEKIIWDDSAEQYRPVRPGDIAILFARMTNTALYERELARRGIGYYVIAGTGFFQQQEVFDILNALCAIDNPFDDVAFAGVLRSSLFGLDDNALMHIAASCETPYLPALAKLSGGGDSAINGLTAAQNESLRQAVDLLGRLNRKKDAIAIDTLIEQVLEATGYEATLLARPQGRRMLGNVRRVLELAREGQAGKVSLSQFIAQMGERVVDQSRFEQAAVAGECEDVVRLMTIHKAKGLQFGAVFVPDLSASRRICNDDLINRVDWGLLYKHQAGQGYEDEQLDPPAKDAPGVSYRLARDLEDRDQQAEDIRKLYVAATRHKDHLVFVAADWRDSKGRFTSGKGPSFYINRIDDALDIRGAIDAGRSEIAYAEGKFTTTVRIIRTAEAPRAGRAPSRGEKLLAGAESPADFVRGVVKSAGRAGPPALIGPVPTSAGRVEIAVTGLNDFAHCPMLYRWAHELRIPEQMCQPNGEGGSETPSKHGLDAATLGTLLHRCMELLDFDRPQSSQGLLDQAASEMGLQEHIDTSRLASELDEMLERFRTNELYDSIRRAGAIFRELDFVIQLGAASIRGQIDALYQDRDGRWHVVDYKSDRVGRHELADHAERYRLQLMLYAAAAARHFGAPPVEARVYFLRPGASHTFPVTDESIDAACSTVAKLTCELISSRRSGQFNRRCDAACPFCRYKSLCLKNH